LITCATLTAPILIHVKKFQVDMSKVKLETIKPWITTKITELMGGIEDDVLVEYVFNQLEADKVIFF
jgi:hypothetical protein